MTRRILCCFLFVLAIGVAVGHAQDNTKFWVSFMRNGGCSDVNSLKLSLVVSAEESCQVTVSNPNTNYKQQFSVSAQDVATVDIPYTQAYNDQNGMADKGLMVQSGRPISLFMFNKADDSDDASRVLSVEELGSNYMLQTNKSIGECPGHPGENRASFLIVATENGTQVEITPTCPTSDGHVAGDVYNVNLDRGQCYHILNRDAGTTSDNDHNGDFSGTKVISNKRIAVFNGNCLTSVPGTETEGFNHVFEQAVPTEKWGKTFVVIRSIKHNSSDELLPDWVKITSLKNNTNVRLNQGFLCLLNEGESYSFEMKGQILTPSGCVLLESTQYNPIAVCLYTHSHDATKDKIGDPSMTWIPPLGQASEEASFSFLPSNESNRYGFLNVVCKTEHVRELQILDNNGQLRNFNTFPVLDGSDYIFAFSEFSKYDLFSNYTVQCPGGFVAYAYYMGQHNSYSFSLGSNNEVLNTQPYIQGKTQVAVANSFWTGEYTYRLKNSAGIDPASVEWFFEDNPPEGPWGIKPNGLSCTISVYSFGERILHAKWGTMDGEDVSITITGSGYGVDDDAFEELKVYPNPAVDEVKVRGSGIIEVTVYNLMGQKIITKPSNGAEELSVKVGDLPQALYLLEIHTVKGNKTKLVSVIQ